MTLIGLSASMEEDIAARRERRRREIGRMQAPVAQRWANQLSARREQTGHGPSINLRNC
jgi:hypothetical protein